MLQQLNTLKAENQVLGDLTQQLVRESVALRTQLVLLQNQNAQLREILKAQDPNAPQDPAAPEVPADPNAPAVDAPSDAPAEDAPQDQVEEPKAA